MPHTKGSIVEILNKGPDDQEVIKYGIVTADACKKQMCLFPMVEIYMFDCACTKYHLAQNVHIISLPFHEQPQTIQDMGTNLFSRHRS